MCPGGMPIKLLNVGSGAAVFSAARLALVLCEIPCANILVDLGFSRRHRRTSWWELVSAAAYSAGTAGT